jgi:hypothetical protein
VQPLEPQAVELTLDILLNGSHTYVLNESLVTFPLAS